MASKEFIYKMLNGHCAYCGKEVSLKKITRDHVIPKSKGGANAVENILPACKSCNQSKGDMNLDDFRLVFFKDRPHPEEEEFYFERVVSKDIEQSFNEHTQIARQHISEVIIKKMDAEPSYRALMKILGLLAIAHDQLHSAVDRYRCWDWDTPVYDMEDDYQMVLAMADNFRRIRNLFLDLVEVRYGTRSFTSLERPYIDIFPNEKILAEIEELEKRIINKEP